MKIELGILQRIRDKGGQAGPNGANHDAHLRGACYDKASDLDFASGFNERARGNRQELGGRGGLIDIVNLGYGDTGGSVLAVDDGGVVAWGERNDHGGILAAGRPSSGLEAFRCLINARSRTRIPIVIAGQHLLCAVV